MIALNKLKVPRELRPVVEEIVGITDSVCLSLLDEEYADLARRAVAKLARKRPSPLQADRRATWAAGVVYALGHVNFLSDPASQPCVTADQLSAFSVAKSTMSSKARQVRDLLRISHFSPQGYEADPIFERDRIRRVRNAEALLRSVTAACREPPHSGDFARSTDPAASALTMKRL